MSIHIKCANPACGKMMRVAEEMAGRKGRCPHCKTSTVVPGKAAGPPPHPPSGAFTAATGGASPRADSIGDASAWQAASLPLIRFDVLGTAWMLLRKQIAVWALAVLIGALLSMAIIVGFAILSVPSRLLLSATLASPFASLAGIAVSMVVWGIFMGGMFRMALNQVDGRFAALGDLLSVKDVLPCWPWRLCS